jgi:hypothetical protein
MAHQLCDERFYQKQKELCTGSTHFIFGCTVLWLSYAVHQRLNIDYLKMA